MVWTLRDDEKAQIPIGRFTPHYGKDSGDFTIRMHYGGRILRNLGSPRYFGGEVRHVDFCNGDELSMLEIRRMAKEIGVTDVDQCVYHFSTVGVNCFDALSLLQNDLDTCTLGQYADANRMVAVFVEHPEEEDDESDIGQSLNCGLKFVRDNEDSESMDNETVNDPFVESQAENEQVHNVYENYAAYRMAFDIRDTTQNSDSDDDVSVGSDSDNSVYLFDSEYDVSDDDVLFEEVVDPEAEWGSKIGSNEAVVCEGTSKERLIKNVSNLHRGYPVVSHKETELDPRFELTKQYPDGDSLRRAIRQHAISSGRDIRWPLNDKKKIQAKCKHKTCPWVIYASRVPGEETMQVKTYMPKHNCPRKQKLKCANAEWIAKRYQAKIWSDPSWPVESMMYVLQHDVKLQFQPHHCYRAKKLVIAMGNITEKEEYALLWSYAAEIKKSDPDNTVKIKCKLMNGVPSFKRMYICWSALRKGFLEGCRPVIFLDGCHLKTQAGGILLTAVGMDGNNGIFPFAYAIVEKEKFKSWAWFISLLVQDLNIQNGGRWTIVSDKQKGLIEAIEKIIPECEHRFCVLHMYKNFKVQHKGLQLKDLLWKAARATRVVDFEKHMKELREKDQAAFEWLAAKPPHHWSRSHFSTFPKTDVLLNNMSESFNALILKARNRPIISMLEVIRNTLMKRVHVRRDKMKSFTGGDLCPKVCKLLEELKRKSMEYIAHWNGLDQFEIESSYGTRFKVSVKEKTRSCRRWELTGIPCPHAISGLWYLGMQPEEYVDQYYSRETFMKAYSYVMPTLDGQDMWPKTPHTKLQPPIPTKLPGRPKKYNRRKEVDEVSKGKKKTEIPMKMSKKGVIMTCTACGDKGHNTRTCPQVPRPSVSELEREIPPPTNPPRGKQSKMKKPAAKNDAQKSKTTKSTAKDKGKQVQGSPSRVTRSSFLPTEQSPRRFTRSSLQSQSAAENVVPTAASTKKTLGVKRKFPVHRQVMQKVRTRQTGVHTNSESGISTQQSSFLSKPTWKPTRSSITQGVRFSTGKKGQDPKNVKFVKD